MYSITLLRPQSDCGVVWCDCVNPSKSNDALYFTKSINVSYYLMMMLASTLLVVDLNCLWLSVGAGVSCYITQQL